MARSLVLAALHLSLVGGACAEVVAVPAGPAAQTEYDAGPLPSSLGLEFAKFRWWAPEGVQVRGVIVLLPGRGGDARGMVGQAQWQKLASDTQFGLMGCQLKNPADNPFQYQGDPNGEVSDVINRALENLLKQNGQKIEKPPLCFWGHSAGGNISGQYASRHPDRVIGAVIMRAPSGPGEFTPAKGQVPLLVFIGLKDKPDWVKYSMNTFNKGNVQSGVWTLAAHPNEGHGVGGQTLYQNYIQAIIDLRLPGSPKLKRISKTSGFLGSPEDFAIAPYAQFRGKKGSAVWFPSESVAQEWQKYMQKGNTPPQ